MAANSVHRTGTTRLQNIPAPAMAPSQQAQTRARMLVPRRIDVIKDHRTPDTFLRMEIDSTTTFIVPIGPKLVSALIQGLERTQRVVTPSTSAKQ